MFLKMWIKSITLKLKEEIYFTSNDYLADSDLFYKIQFISSKEY